MKAIHYILAMILCSIQVAGHASAMFVNESESYEQVNQEDERVELEEDLVIENHQDLKATERRSELLPDYFPVKDGIKPVFYEAPAKQSAYHKLFILHSSLKLDCSDFESRFSVTNINHTTLKF